MRLLQLTHGCKLSLTRDLINNIPPYAILSHTWGGDDEEVTFQDLSNESEQARLKVGYRKILFCGEQAARDNLQYFWVDTCCIDKTNNTELSEAINSMFRWYRNAAKCYVYLADVSTSDDDSTDLRGASFRRSRWFTRGWTLQELIAPRSVEFFSAEGAVIGDKSSTEQVVHEITGIAIQALRGEALFDFSVAERMTWAEARRTTREEDKAYCLLGIFDVSMPLIYGEGEKNALHRLQQKISAFEGELKLPFAVEAPFNSYQRQHEPACLENTRVDLLRHIYEWISGPDKASIFWLNGFAGTGKSTIARTVARTYSKRRCLGASFFFVKGGGDVGSASKLFPTMATQLARTVPTLHQHIYNAAAEHKDISHQSLRDQWTHLILEPLSKLKPDGHGLQSSYVLVIDALDECSNENDIRIIPQLLTEARSLGHIGLRIFLTSRPEVPIRHSFLHIPGGEHQDFVLHNISPPVIDRDIQKFLVHDLRLIAQERLLGPDWPSDDTIRVLVQRASGLFIWAATACRFIRQGRQFAPKRLSTIISTNSSSSTAPERHLDQIYMTVLKQSVSDEYTGEEKEELCAMLRNILGTIILLHSPLSVQSLGILLGISKVDISQSLEDLHSVVDISQDDTQPLRIHHPSFRDFLLDQERCTDPQFCVNEKRAHKALTGYCIRVMSTSLKQDICAVEKPGTLAQDVENDRIQRCIPPELQYACIYWTQHLQKSDKQHLNNGQVHNFLKEHLLHWLEALAWMGKLSEGFYMISAVESLITERCCVRLEAFIDDAKRFFLYTRTGIELAPLQTYSSALVFSPLSSTTREQFAHCIPHWVVKLPRVEFGWKPLMQTLESHSSRVNAVAFSYELLASASNDRTVKLWDPASGALLQTLQGHSRAVSAIAFQDGQLVSASEDGTIKLWDPNSGRLLKSIQIKPDPRICGLVAFSAQLFLSTSRTSKVEVWAWDQHLGTLRHTLECRDRIERLVLSSAGIIALSHGCTIELWDARSGELLRTLELGSNWEYHWSETVLAFSINGKLFAIAYDIIILSNADSGEFLRTLNGHNDSVRAIAFSPDGQLLASASRDCTIRLWDIDSGSQLASIYDVCISTVCDIVFWKGERLLASANENGNIQLWDTHLQLAELHTQTLRAHSEDITAAVFSPEGNIFSSGSLDGRIKIWSTTSGRVLQTLMGHSQRVSELAISPNGNIIASGAPDATIKLWGVWSGLMLRTLIGHTSVITQLTFSPDGKFVASGSLGGDCNIKLWKTPSGLLQQTLQGHSSTISAIIFSPDGSTLASGTFDSMKMWITRTGALLWTLDGYHNYSRVLFAPNGKLVSMQDYNGYVKLLDATSGELMQSIKLPSEDYKLSFSEDSSFLLVDGEPLYSIASNQTRGSIPKPAPSIDVKHDWVYWGTERILWLPPEYRPLPTLFYVHGNILALCLRSRRVIFVEFAFKN